MPEMATGTIADERTRHKRELETTRNELAAAMARYAAAEVAASAGAVRSGIQRWSTGASGARHCRRRAVPWRRRTATTVRTAVRGMRRHAPGAGNGCATWAGANPVLWVRCARLSGWFHDYWNERFPKAA